MYRLDLKNKTKNYIEFKFNQKYEKVNPALKVSFNEDYNYNLKVLKKIKALLEKGITFKSGRVNFILENYNEDIIHAFYAFGIKDKKKKYTYIYDIVCQELKQSWQTNNPCKFCDNKCVSARNNYLYLEEDGCCYSFEWVKNMIKPVRNKQKCKYLSEDKRCKVKNISCLLFTCKYLNKKHLFNIDYKNILLLNLFFNKKEKLVLRYNFFHTEEEIINKLMKKNNTPYLIYYFTNKFSV